MMQIDRKVVQTPLVILRKITKLSVVAQPLVNSKFHQVPVCIEEQLQYRIK